MGMSSGGDNNGMMAEINVTPFVDVMLVLLIIFMVTAPMMNQGVQVQLPKATADQLPTDEKALVLSISESGDYFMAEESYDISELKLKLQAIAAANPDKEVFIRADALVFYEKVV
jgi:biopolymer transport protein TolR